MNSIEDTPEWDGVYGPIPDFDYCDDGDLIKDTEADKNQNVSVPIVR